MSEIIQLFYNDLYKDKRKIEIIESNGKTKLRKYYISTEENKTETFIINFLSQKMEDSFPKIYSNNLDFCDMEYYNGIRIFNLLVFIDAYSVISKEKSVELKNYIMQKCENRQKTIIQLLSQCKETSTTPYPIDKVDNVLKILIKCLNLKNDIKPLILEIEKLRNYWNSVCTVPFRDATTKNMLLKCDDLSLKNFKNDEERKAFIFKNIENNKIYKYLNGNIVDYDFCSCIHRTTPEDDVISLMYHERTWDGGIPNIDKMSKYYSFDFDTYRLGITFLVRFLRFGGRKLAYKLIHINAFNARFKYDNPYYYFFMLPIFIENINKNVIKDYPAIFDCIKKITDKMDNLVINVDYFEKSGIVKMEHNYSDIFPR